MVLVTFRNLQKLAGNTYDCLSACFSGEEFEQLQNLYFNGRQSEHYHVRVRERDLYAFLSAITEEQREKLLRYVAENS